MLSTQLFQPHNKKMPRFLYLNIYSFLLVCAGILALILPFYSITKWTLVVQGIVAIKLFFISGKLFSTWNEKKREIDLLVNRNKNEFRPDTFEVFMQAPCGRLIVHEALRELNILREYKTLLKLQKPLLERLRNNCTPSKTVIFINEEPL
jgi:hypothetical protein